MALAGFALLEENGAAAQARSCLHASQADKSLPVRLGKGRTPAKHVADETGALSNHTAEPEILEHGAAIDFGAGDMALLDTQRAQRLDPVGSQPKRASDLDQPAP